MMDEKTAENIADALEEISKTLEGIYELLYIATNKVLETSKR